MSTIKIDKGFSFNSRNRKTNIELHRNSLKEFEKNFDKALKLDNDFPIILDTNVLIRYYKVSFKARERLFKFINDNKDRIFITDQIQKEFTSNRRNNIEKYFQEVKMDLLTIVDTKFR